MNGEWVVNDHRVENQFDTEADQLNDIEDEAERDDAVVSHRYDITSFGIDFDIEGLVRRLNSEDITIPDWQRQYIWSIRQASSFIESLLIGLPVPGVFLGRDDVSGKLFVIDGQQRLKTLQFFYGGEYGSGVHLRRPRPFKLVGVADRLEGISFKDLGDPDRRNLSNSLIHATVVRQESPADNDTSMYQIFKRLNDGGARVVPQEIRSAVYQGRLINTIRDLNEDSNWRRILGSPNRRMKDQEMILRFFALLYEGDQYTRPMAEFLNAFTKSNRNPDKMWIQLSSDLFRHTIGTFATAMGRPFRLSERRAVNVAVFDSMAVGLATRIRDSESTPSPSKVEAVHDSLIESSEFLQAVIQSTSDEASVAKRLKIAIYAFRNA